ncbi:iron-containing alcohol dehydrogenase [Mucilaginibacter paludis]|uniref:Iron-containing alcohol dehydrogenase n=1 Tax=Mucilaginibacter paludis DSM 18603 TaxID=714943 RepID=H1Y1F7_9SPHI|nr:iron-containing alcohol dehydrogenase [Mucilaginibacter paludis]EHQ30831.1 iron-containing alcohol dehydrogenase [Mucilaginibacter paludis DSM 18603]
MNSIPNLTIHFPAKLVFGKGCISELPAEIAKLSCKKVFILTITPLLSKIEELTKQLEALDITVSVNTDIVQEPTFADFDKLMLQAGEIKPDMVIGIGGGSVLDVAKLVAAQLDNTQSLADIVGIGLLKGRSKKLICVPATSGTGSEVSPNAILVDPENQKKGIISPYLVPDAVYVDPLLTMSVPGSITAATGLDALTHCLEAYTNKFAQPFIDLYAYEGMRLIGAHIVQAVKNGDDEEARTQVAMGSLLGGFCLGPVNTAAVHALAYPLGSSFHLAHGLSNALLLPYVMKFNSSAAPGKYAGVALALGCIRGDDDLQTAKKGIEKIEQLIRECGIPARLRDVGIPKDAIPQMAEDAMKITRLLKNNPRELNYQDAVDIYTDAY